MRSLTAACVGVITIYLVQSFTPEGLGLAFRRGVTALYAMLYSAAAVRGLRAARPGSLLLLAAGGS